MKKRLVRFGSMVLLGVLLMVGAIGSVGTAEAHKTATGDWKYTYYNDYSSIRCDWPSDKRNYQWHDTWEHWYWFDYANWRWVYSHSHLVHSGHKHYVGGYCA